MKKKILLGMMAVALMSLMTVSAVSACVGPGLSPGFWKHNVGVYLGEKKGSYSDPGVTGLRIDDPTYPPTSSPVTKDNMKAWLTELKGAPWNLDLQALYDKMNTKGGGAVGAGIRVGAANVFNYWADLYPYGD